MVNFLILIMQLVFSILGYFLWLRFLLQWASAPINNIFTIQIIKICKPLLKPFQYIIGSHKRYNLTCLLLLLLLNVVEVVLFIWIVDSTFPNIGGLLLFALIKMFSQLCTMIFYGTIIYAIMSWFPNLMQSALGECIIAIINPMAGFFRRFIPTMGIFDFSAMALLIAVMLAQYGLAYLLKTAVVLALA